MERKCILFDLDGTLTDSGPCIIHCFVATMEHYGLPIPDDAALRTIIGPPLRGSFQRFGVAADMVDEVVVHYRKLYQKGGKYENIPYPGIGDLLRKLKEDGHRLFVATSKPEHMAVDILQHFGLDHWFEIICGSAMDGLRDKKEDVIAYLLEKAGGKENCIMVGDTVFDVVGAAYHKIPTVVVGWGYGVRNDMIHAGAIAVADTMDELYGLLSK